MQDGAARACGAKVWKTLMSIDISRNAEKRSERTLMCSRLLRCMRGTGPRATGAGVCVFFRCLARDRPSRYGYRGVRFFSVLCEGQALALRGPGCVFFGALRGTGPRPTGVGVRFFRSAGTCPPRSRPHPVHPANPGHPASDAREINSIDIQVRWTWCRVLGACRSARACPSPAFQLSEAGCAGLSGCAGWGRSGIWPKGLEDLNVYRHQQA